MIHRLLLLLFAMLPFATVALAQDDAVEATLYQTVNVRTGPDTRFEIVAQVSAGDTVLLTGRGEQGSLWLRVELMDGAVGWVPSYLLIFEGDIADLPVVGADDEEGSTAGGSGVVMVTAYGTVNVRSGPSIIEEIVAQLDVGDEARALARSNERNDWLYVENTALTGWVAYFTVDVQGDPRTLPLRVPDIATEDLVDPRELITTLFNVQLRAEPSLDAEVVGLLDFNTDVTAFARGDNPAWLYIGTDALRGWAAAELFDISLGHLEALPTYSEDATYELLPDEEAEPVVDASATEEPTPAVSGTPFLFAPSAEATPTATPAS
jgi:uncharacterized protein YraI